MTQWWNYRLEDLLLFSSGTYYRLFELYHRDVWPLQILAVLLGITILRLASRNPPRRGRLIAFFLAAAWLWVAWAYHLRHYATIAWFADYFALGFALQALLLIGSGVCCSHGLFQAEARAIRWAGPGIFLFSLLVLPVVVPLLGRDWRQTELFAMTPDATAIASLGLLLLCKGKTFWVLAFIPLCWCMISAATLWAMDSPAAFISALVALAVVILAPWRR